MGPKGGGNFYILWTFDKVVTLCGKSFFMVGGGWIRALLVISRLGAKYGRGILIIIYINMGEEYKLLYILIWEGNINN